MLELPMKTMPPFSGGFAASAFQRGDFIFPFCWPCRAIIGADGRE